MQTPAVPAPAAEPASADGTPAPVADPAVPAVVAEPATVTDPLPVPALEPLPADLMQTPAVPAPALAEG